MRTHGDTGHPVHRLLPYPHLQVSESVSSRRAREVIVADGASGRFLPAMQPRTTLTDADGNSIGPMEIPFVWHPGVLHYGRKLELPGEGTYSIEIDIDPPTFPRHDERNGDRYTESAQARFENVKIEPGKK